MTRARDEQGRWTMRLEGVEFGDPVPLLGWPAPGIAGVYVILAAAEIGGLAIWVPAYVGEAEDLSARVSRSHEGYDCWVRTAGDARRLYVAVHTSRGDDPLYRSALAQRLRDSLNPACNGQ